MADAHALPPAAPRRRGRLSNMLAAASMASWLVLGAMPIAAVIVALT